MFSTTKASMELTIAICPPPEARKLAVSISCVMSPCPASCYLCRALKRLICQARISRKVHTGERSNEKFAEDLTLSGSVGWVGGGGWKWGYTHPLMSSFLEWLNCLKSVMAMISAVRYHMKHNWNLPWSIYAYFQEHCSKNIGQDPGVMISAWCMVYGGSVAPGHYCPIIWTELFSPSVFCFHLAWLLSADANYVSPRRGIRFVFAPVSDRSLSLSLSLSLFYLSFHTFFLE